MYKLTRVLSTACLNMDETDSLSGKQGKVAEEDTVGNLQLQKCHFGAFLVQVAQVIALAVLYRVGDCHWPLQVSTHGCEFGLPYTTSINMCGIVLASIVFSAFMHLVLVFYASHSFERKFRWIEFAGGAGLNVFVTYVLCGASEIPELVAFVLLYAWMADAFNVTERGIVEDGDFGQAYILGLELFGTVWLMVLVRLLVSSRHSDGGLPAAVFVLVFLQLAIHTGFCVLLYCLGNKTSDTLRVRIAFVVLSVASTSVVSWTNYAGARGGVDART